MLVIDKGSCLFFTSFKAPALWQEAEIFTLCFIGGWPAEGQKVILSRLSWQDRPWRKGQWAQLLLPFRNLATLSLSGLKFLLRGEDKVIYI